MKLLRTLLAVLLTSVSGLALAQEWPTRTIRFIVPWPPGGINDVLARAFNEKVGQSLGQVVVTDFKAGAAGRIGVTEIARATPDGYTIGMGNLGPLTIHPVLYDPLPYNVKRDLVPVTMFAASPLVLVVTADSPFRTATDFFEAARARPGTYNFASVGIGSPAHLTFELVNTRAGLKLIHVPYKGSNESIPAMLAGDTHATFDTLSSLKPFIEAGKLRPLAVTTAQRVPQLPEVPTLIELKALDEPILSWYALIVPTGTPASVVDRLYRDYSAAAQTPEIRKLLDNQGLVFVPTTPAQFRDNIERETARWTRIIRDNGIEAKP